MEQELQRIEGTVEYIVFKSKNSSYTIFDFYSNGELITVVGKFGDIHEGESLVIHGNYTNHAKFGEQFQAIIYEEKLPDTSFNIEKYLASGVIKGIGEKLASRIVARFGNKTLEIIESEPHRLVEVKGISIERCNEISAELKKAFALRTLSAFLMKYNVEPSIITDIYIKYGIDAFEKINENPYILCEKNIYLDFKIADAIAFAFGRIEENKHSRIVAFICDELRKCAEHYGHSCMPLKYIFNRISTELNIYSDKEVSEVCTEAFEKEEPSFFIYEYKDYKYISLPEYYIAEKYIAERIKSMNAKKQNISCDAFIDDEEQINNIEYESLQREAISSAMTEKMFILTGGPGTGKTTTLKAIISILKKMGMNVMLTAPTGRATKRLEEITGHNAKTIHRLLEMKSDSDKFSRNEKNPLICNAVIVDEASMVDVLLFEALLRAMKPDCKLIFTGDSDQLPSVQAGNLLRDLIDGQAVKFIRLEKIFRQAQQSCIITNAHKIVNGEYPDLTEKKNDFFFMRRSNSENAVRLVAELVKTRLPNAYNYSPFDDIQVISPSRKGTAGTNELNKILQDEINVQNGLKIECNSINGLFRQGDKVMQNVNNYEIEWEKDGEKGNGIFNGDIGRIKSINLSEKKMTIDFDGRIAEYPFESLMQIELAYAITVHKSQGCEFEAVVMPVQDGFDMLNHRNLLYTAVTRAKKLLILIGSEPVIYKMVDNMRSTERHTNLKSMFERN